MRTFAKIWRRRASGKEFAAEIEAHVALETDRLIGEGWSPRDASYEARRRFGNVARTRERYYDRTHVMLLDDLGRDVRYAVRSLARDKAYVAAAVGALGVGLAANIALFALFSAIALRPLPVPNPARLVSISQVKPPIRFGTFSIADFFFYRDNSRTLGSVAIAQPSHLRLAAIASSPTAAPAAAAPGAVAEPVIALFVTTNYFETFGVQPVVGRALRPDDEAGNGAFAAMISDNYWERRFGRDPSVIGSTLIVSGIRANIVGVTPHDFAGVREEVPDLWITLSALGDVRQRATRETSACCEMVGRLADRYTLRDAQGELANLAALRRLQLPPSERQMTVTVSPAVSFGRLGEQVRPLFVALQVAMLLVLFIACANVASLMLGRAAAREREVAVRLATGAGRGRLVRQLLTEGIVVAAFSGLLATLVTGYALTTGAKLLSAFLSRDGGGTLALTISGNGKLAIYVAGMSILAGIMFALAPSLQASRADLVGTLRITGGTGAAGSLGRLRRALIAAQIALSVALLIAATGLARSAMRVAHTDPGFRAEGVLSVWLTNPQELALPPDRAREIEAEIRRRIAALPNVQSVAIASRVPLGGNVSASAMLPTERLGRAETADAGPRYPYSFVSETFFTTLGIGMMRGRTFTEEEVRDSAHVAVISDSMARVLWPGGDALGKQIAFGTKPSAFNAGPGLTGSSEVIGIVGNVRGLSMSGVDVGDVYLPRLTNDWSSRILLQTRGDVAALIREVPRIVHDVEPALPVSVQSMTDVVAADASVTTARVGAAILAAVGVIGLLLASVGVYGTVSYAVRQKQREIGIRIALGATGAQVLIATLRDTVVWLGYGAAAGVVLGIVGVKLTNAVLAGASVAASIVDPMSMLVVPAVIAAVAVVAASLSARKATLTNPATVLRSDG